MHPSPQSSGTQAMSLAAWDGGLTLSLLSFRGVTYLRCVPLMPLLTDSGQQQHHGDPARSSRAR
jgi:hypothetical protein